LATTTKIICGLQKFSKFSEKRAKPLLIFFFIFLNFLAIFMRPNSVLPSLGRVQMVSRKCCKNFRFYDKRAKSYACFIEGISSYVFWKAQHGGGGSS